jgi:hypothetical protein
MLRRLPLAAAVLLAASTLAAVAAAAPAGPKDAAVLKVDAEAMSKDYLDTQFNKAKSKLDKAITTCGKSGCSNGVLARLYRDLGVILVGGLNKPADGKKAFAKARELDPKLTLDKDYVTPAVKKLWGEAKGAGAGPAAEEMKVVHTPVTEQKVGYPIPIYATLEGADAAADLQMRLWYKAPDASSWSKVTMTKHGDGFSADVPCGTTSKEGDLSYFVAAHGPDGEALAKAGSREEPLKITLKKELDGEAPHLPDGEPPKKCSGDDVAPAPAAAAGGVKSNWFFVTFEQDLAFLGSGNGVCGKTVQASGEWACFRADGTQYRGNPVKGFADGINAGLALATTHIHAGYDRVLTGGLTAGIRAGAAIRGTAPTSTGAAGHGPMPAYFEARAAYWFGSDVFSTSGARPVVFLGGGAASVDTLASVPVKEDLSIPSSQKNPKSQSLDAWRSMGDGFFGGGVGLMYAFTPSLGILVDARFARLFPRGGNALMPELAFGFGL